MAKAPYRTTFHPEQKAFRLRRNRDFQAIYQQGRFFATNELVLYCLPYDEEKKELPSKIGFSVARKLGSAVKRNRLRRRLKEVVRLTGSLLPPSGMGYVVLARPAAQNLSFEELDRVYRTLLKRLQRWLQENPRHIAKGR